MRTAVAWLATVVAFVGLDAIWLALMGPRLYAEVLGEHMRPTVDALAALVFYLVYTVALVVFVVGPALDRDQALRALALGALFGLAAYATYDLSNQATLKFWQWRLTLLDIGWGATASAATAFISFHLTQLLTRS